MTMQDPIADMFIRLQNAQSVYNASVSMPSSKFKIEIAKVLEEEGYITGFEVGGDEKKPQLSVILKYFKDKPVITRIKRVSKPSLRVYRKNGQLPKVVGGLGVAIVSTAKGVMSDKKARAIGEGGEIICYVE